MRARVTALALLATIPTVLATPAAAEGGWIEFATTSTSGAEVREVQGSRDAEGVCSIPVRLSLRPGAEAVTAHEVAHDPAKCRSRIAYSEAAPRSGGGGMEVDQERARPEGASPVGTAATRTSAGYLRSWLEDPIAIEVNAVTNSVTWGWSGLGCVTPGTGGKKYEWLTASGWDRLENEWQNTFTCAEQISSSYVHFRNDIFCASMDTDAYYNRNTVRGLSNGELKGEYFIQRIGFCKEMLSAHFRLKRTQG